MIRTSTVGCAVLVVCATVSSSVLATDFVADAPLRFEFDPAGAPAHVLLAALDDEAVASDSELVHLREIPMFGSEGSWRWYLHGEFAQDVKTSDNTIYGGGVGFEYFIADDLSLDMEFNGLYFDQNRGDAVAANFNLFFRWHFYAERTWSLYADAGAGMLVASEEVPGQGSNFNFTPQAGFGVTFEVAEDIRAMVGLKWHHVSNANLAEENPGRDSVMLYAGVNFPF